VPNAIRDEGKYSGDTLIFYRQKHHWAWFIPLDDEVTSVGVVVPTDYFQSKNESRHDFLVRELHELNSELKNRIPEIKFTEPVRAISNFSYHCHEFTGKGYLCVGDSHRFIDPIFSFGLFFAMKEAQLASDAIAEYMDGKKRDQANPFAEYQAYCTLGMDAIQDVIDAFWDHPYAFAVFVHQRYREDMIDLFAGRCYQDPPSPGLRTLRALNELFRKGPDGKGNGNGKDKMM